MSTTLTLAVETDTALADIFDKQAKASNRVDQIAYSIRREAGHRQSYRGNRREWEGGELIDAINAVTFVSQQTPTTYVERNAAELIGKWNAAMGAVAALHDAEAVLNKVYADAGGWSRFFLVTNTNGHIHSSMRCSTCRFDTSFAWLPALSGLTEADAVASHGAILCTVCFPSAPVEWTNGENKATTEAKAARAEAKAARDAAKRAKMIREDGAPIYVVTSNYDADRGNRGDRIETIAAAKMKLTDLFEDDRFYGASTVRGEARQILAQALAERQGTSGAEELEAAAKRAAKRR